MKKIQKVLLIVNPISGNIDKTLLMTMITVRLQKENISLEMYETTGENDQVDIRKIIDNKVFDRVFVAGGDGTLKMLAEVMLDHRIPLAVFPSGSANGLALNLEIPQTIEEQIEVALGQNLIAVNLLEIDNQICLHISDFGLNAELIKNYESSAIRGKMGYFLQSLPTLWESKYPFEFTIQIEDRRLKRSGVLLAFANAQKYGTGANVNPHAKMDDDIFELLIYKSLDVKEILKTLSNEATFDPDVVEIFPVTKAQVACHQPVAFQIDGEYCGEKEKVTVQLSSKKLSILIP
ncbi:MAG: diacylglycerol kinase [Psychroflexus sp.]|nr:diacylglycerol kinase [Psychroflexus sp.]MDN6309343.1 diacylglycerol kinase [Psychroflexus sp.]